MNKVLLKAALIAGATRLPGYAPTAAVFDNHQGFGRVNLDAVLSPLKPVSSQFIEVKPGLKTGEIHAIQIKVKSGKAPLRVTMAYSDFPAENNRPSLVNNLNLIVTAPGGRRHIGNQSREKALTCDVRNNVEVVHIQTPTAGTWKIEVVGANVPKGPQDFALVCRAHV